MPLTSGCYASDEALKFESPPAAAIRLNLLEIARVETTATNAAWARFN